MRTIVTDLALHTVLLLLPIAAGAAVASLRARHPAVLLASGMAAAAATAYAVGLLWYATPTLGRVGAWALLAGAVATVVAVAWRRRESAVRAARAVALPFAATTAYALTVLGLGFLYGGYDTPLQTAASRFTWALPIDNQLPLLFARHVEQVGHETPIPLVGDWLPSDRPPLQSAFWLAHSVRSLPDAAAAVDYQVLGVLLQSTWVLGVWVLVGSLAVRRTTAVLAVAACAGLSVVFLNTFYVWPKLLAAAFVVAALGLVLRPLGARPVPRMVLATALACFGFLSHGGVAFVLLPLVVVAAVAVLRSAQRWRAAAMCAAVAAVVLVPWVLFQRLVAPPADRLLKWMLAGVVPVDPRPATEVVVERYREVGLDGAFANKLDNLREIVSMPASGAVEAARAAGLHGFDVVVSVARVQYFHSLLPSLGLLIALAIVALVPGARHTTDRRAGVVLLGVGLASVVFWVLVMFGPRTTINHQGTYALQLVLASALVCLGASRSTRATAVVVGLSGVLGLALCLPHLPDPTDPGPMGLSRSALVVLVVGAATFVGALVALARTGAEPAFPTAGGAPPAAEVPILAGPLPGTPNDTEVTAR